MRETGCRPAAADTAVIRRRRGLATAALGALLLFAAAGCEEKNTYVAPPPPKVTVAAPLRQPVTDYLDFTGNTQAIYTVQLPARVEGYLVGVHFQDGADVKKGDLLFTIQPEQYQAQLQQAEASLLDQKAALTHAETELQRYSRLVQQKAAPQTEVDRWQFERDQARAGVLNAQAQIDLAKLNIGYTRVVAPFDGRMGRRLIDPGNLVGHGGETVLAEINQIDPIYVYFTINELQLLRVKRIQQEEGGMDYRTAPVPAFIGLANETGYPHEGRIDFAAITVDPSTGTLLLRAIVPNRNRAMVPGLFARVRVPIGRRAESLLVPETALGADQLGRYVLVVNEQNIVERRGVKVGALVDGNRVIEEGLAGGERVIVNGMMRAIPGRQVAPEVETAAAPAAAPAGAPRPATGG